MPLEALQGAAPRRTRTAIAAQMALGQALRKAEAIDAAIARVRARRGAGADRRPATTARTRRLREIALEKQDDARARDRA